MTSATLPAAQPDWRNFTVPVDRSATEPPEERGTDRDEVRLLVASDDGIRHSHFVELAEHLRPGDLVVVNDSATLPAAFDIRRGDGSDAVAHLAAEVSPAEWILELRTRDRQRVTDAVAGEPLALPLGRTATLLDGWPDAQRRRGSRLWRASVAPPMDAVSYLGRFGRPITYEHIRGSWPLSAYQTIFAHKPGSAEMPSASRPFSARVVAALNAGGVGVAAVTLHTGVSSPEHGEPPAPERFEVTPPTARRINSVRANGGRVIASGTTVTRALETVADGEGHVHPAHGWTDLVLGERRTRVVDGLITGWHEARSSHLRLLEAVAGQPLTATAYQEAIANDYLWHEFGDSCLLLPGRASTNSDRWS